MTVVVRRVAVEMPANLSYHIPSSSSPHVTPAPNKKGGSYVATFLAVCVCVDVVRTSILQLLFSLLLQFFFFWFVSNVFVCALLLCFCIPFEVNECEAQID